MKFSQEQGDDTIIPKVEIFNMSKKFAKSESLPISDGLVDRSLWFMAGGFFGAMIVGLFLSLAYSMGEDRGHDRMEEYAVLAEVEEWYKKPDGTQGFRWVRRAPQTK